MKKLIIVFCLIFLAIPLFASTTYYVDTNKGKQPVVIPDGSTELDVLLKVAAAYYNLNDDYESLQTKVEDLTSSIEEYVAENKQLRTKYDDLIKDYDLVIKKYQQLSSTKLLQGIVGTSITFGDSFSFDVFTLQAGALILEKIGVTASVGYSNMSKKILFGVSAQILF